MNSIFFYIALFTSLISIENPKLTVNISNVPSLKGEIIIGVFNKEQNFLKDGAAIKTYTLKINEMSETIVIEDLPRGDYAISIYHDENSDSECNLNFMGIPKEAYGFSNNFKPKFSAPEFKNCKFSLSSNMVLNIKLIH